MAFQQVLENQTSGPDGRTIFSPIIPASTIPGFYDVRVHAPNDLSDNLSDSGAGRWLGNESFVNLTVQVPSLIQIDSIPPEVTAGQYFTVVGQVVDAVDSNRTVNGPMQVEVFFLGDDSETLVQSHATSSNGSFTISVPTDPLGDGVTSGTKTVVFSVINGSTTFYLTGTGNASILVRGVTQFVDKTPLINTVVDRGSSITFGARLVELSDNDKHLSNLTIGAKFHDTWLTEIQTNGAGLANFSFDVPHSHPLGLVAITLFFNGSENLHSTASLITTITVRSPTNLNLDTITDNPAAGESFTVTGNLTSSNGSGITDRNGNTLSPSLTFSIDGESSTFSVVGGTVSPNGSWSVVIHLDLTFPRGAHDLMATYTPNVNPLDSKTLSIRISTDSATIGRPALSINETFMLTSSPRMVLLSGSRSRGSSIINSEYPRLSKVELPVLEP